MTALPKQIDQISAEKKSDQKLVDLLKSRQSSELVVGFSGPIGCDIASVIQITGASLRNKGYEIITVKLSNLLKDCLEQDPTLVTENVTGAPALQRYRNLQEVGKQIRAQTENDAILAEYAVKEVSAHRAKYARPDGDGPTVPRRVAYLIDQLKRPEEVEFLRILYRNLFFQIGVTKIYDNRIEGLEKEGLSSDEAKELERIDRNENEKHGQKLEKTLHLSDFFIRNDSHQDAKSSINRVVDLIHGDLSHTPTLMEQGMYAAYAAGLNSACMSRQVGAAIMAEDGQILATGCNDVPKAGGGLYNSSDSNSDHRCLRQPDGMCHNVAHKRELQNDIGEIIKSASGITDSNILQSLLDGIYSNTRLKDLIEFSRSVHAEMDAIVSLARNGGFSTKGATLYTTTFPCHSCARHIVAAGISEVIYIEPYEKSLAKDLHSDSISFTFSETEAQNSNKVRFKHFEGVAPTRFTQLFQFRERKDNTGKFISISPIGAATKIPEYLDNYQDFEAKTVANFTEEMRKISKVSLTDFKK